MVYEEKFFDCYECQKKVSEFKGATCYFKDDPVPRSKHYFHKECFLEFNKKKRTAVTCWKCEKEITSPDFKAMISLGVVLHIECYWKTKYSCV